MKRRTAKTNTTADAQASTPTSIVGIGASAGGLEALKRLLAALGPRTDLALIVVQHLDPSHKSQTADILSRSTSIPVSEVEDGTRVEPNHLYVIPSDSELTISNGVLALSPRSHGKGGHLTINAFFESLAAHRGTNVIGVILSGTGFDGALGLKAIKAEGGLTFAQEPSSTQYPGMPETAIKAGVADFVLTPEGIAKELNELGGAAESAPLETDQDAKDLQTLFHLLRGVAHVDFSDYKPSTIKRRILRKMKIHKQDRLSSYIRFLETHPEAVKSLCDEMFIHVTDFFRDPESFHALKESVFPRVLKNKAPGAPIRIWVPGCSTGEEAYSLAMALVEALGPDAARIQIQIFATDISEDAIRHARTGVYAEHQCLSVSKERRSRFFDETEGGCKIKKAIRDLCVFSRHDVTNNPPFAKIDLISCRNVLIYFAPALQQKVLPIFHYSLNPNGILWLGKSEAPSGFSKLFNLIDKSNKIYSKINTATPMSFRFPTGRHVLEPPDVTQKGSTLVPAAVDSSKEFDRVLMSRYSPAAVIINSDMEILQIRGRTGSFLEFPSGQPTYNLLKAVRPALLPTVRMSIQAAMKQNSASRREGLSYEHGGRREKVSIEVVPANPSAPPKERQFFVFFEDGAGVLKKTSSTKTAPKKAKSRKKAPDQTEAYVSQLLEELDTTREHQQVLAESYESVQEELTSANEELQSANEELQSTNEELETAQEELQATNEELTTLNDELESRNLKLDALNSALELESAQVHLFEAVAVAASEANNVDEALKVFLDRTCAHAGWSVGHAYILSGQHGFTSRNVWYFDDHKKYSSLRKASNDVALSPGASLVSRIVTTRKPVLITDIQSDQTFPRAGPAAEAGLKSAFAFPVLVGQKVEAILEYFSGETIAPDDRFLEVMGHMGAQLGRVIERKRGEAKLHQVIEAAPNGLLIVDQDGAITLCNAEVEALFGHPRDELIGKPIESLVPERFRGEHSAHRAGYFAEPEARQMGAGRDLAGLRKDGTEFPVEIGLSPVRTAEESCVLASIVDITERKAIERKLRDAIAIRDEFLSIASHELKTPVTALKINLQLTERQLYATEPARKLPPEVLQKAAKSSIKQIDRLTLLIEDLLDVSKIQAGKLSLRIEEMDLSELVRDVCSRFGVQMSEARCALETSLGERVTGLWDHGRIEQIVVNLVSNVIKYASGRPVKITTSTDGKTASLVIQDSGPGIPKEMQSRVFERFERATSSKSIGGLGLGLFIVKEIAAAHRGSVQLESEPGKGSKFTVRLPVSRPE